MFYFRCMRSVCSAKAPTKELGIQRLSLKKKTLNQTLSAMAVKKNESTVLPRNMTHSNRTQPVTRTNLNFTRFSKLSNMVSLLRIVQKAWLRVKINLKMPGRINAKVKAMGRNHPLKRQNHRS